MVRNTTFRGATPEFLEFVALSAFERQALGLLEEEDLHRLEQRLLMNPTAGSLVPGTGGIRKLRIPAKGRGTRGGARVIYYLRTSRSRIYLVAVYAKNVREDLTADDRKYFRRLTAILDREG